MRSRRSGLRHAERAHVMQPVGQLDDDDADVVHHRQQHLAIVLGLAVFGGEEIDLTQFGDAVDAAGNFFAEILLDIGDGDGGVFDDVVKQTGFDTDDIEAHTGEKARHGERVAHIGFTGNAPLAGVILRSKFPGVADGGDVVFGARFAEGRDQLFELVIW